MIAGLTDEAVPNNGSGVLIPFPDGTTVEHASPAGKLSSNVLAQETAVLESTKLLQNENPAPAKSDLLHRPQVPYLLSLTWQRTVD